MGGETIVMAHAVLGPDGDVVARADEFSAGEVDGVALDDFLGEVLECVFAGGGGCEAPEEERGGEAGEARGEEGHCLWSGEGRGSVMARGGGKDDREVFVRPAGSAGNLSRCDQIDRDPLQASRKAEVAAM